MQLIVELFIRLLERLFGLHNTFLMFSSPSVLRGQSWDPLFRFNIKLITEETGGIQEVILPFNALIKG